MWCLIGFKFASNDTQTFSRQSNDLSRETAPNTGGHIGDDLLLASETIETGREALTNTYVYDTFGNKEQVTVSGMDFEPRTTKTFYQSAHGRYPQSSKNALDHEETYEYNHPMGNRTALTGPNKLTTRWHYDAIGRLEVEERADGTSTVTLRQWCNTSNCEQLPGMATPVYKVITRTLSTGNSEVPAVQTAPTSEIYYDKKDRVILTKTESFNQAQSGWIYQTTHYDERGRKYSESRPFFKNEGKGQTVYQYDDLDRPIV